jgi:hypothetical protein
MTITCSSAPRCLRDLLKAMLRSTTMKSMATNNIPKGYYLADDIYPRWSIFVKTISEPQGQKNLNLFHARSLVERMSSKHLVCSKLISYSPVPCFYLVTRANVRSDAWLCDHTQLVSCPETRPQQNDSRRAPIDREAYTHARLKCRHKPAQWITSNLFTNNTSFFTT